MSLYHRKLDAEERLGEIWDHPRYDLADEPANWRAERAEAMDAWHEVADDVRAAEWHEANDDRLSDWDGEALEAWVPVEDDDPDGPF